MKALHDLLSHHIDDLEDVMAALKDVCDHPYALSGRVPIPSALLGLTDSHSSTLLHQIYKLFGQ